MTRHVYELDWTRTVAYAATPTSQGINIVRDDRRDELRAELADALRRVLAAGIRLDGASDHGVSQALYLRDPDENGVELYYDRPREEWPMADDGSGVAMSNAPVDLRALLAEADEGRA